MPVLKKEARELDFLADLDRTAKRVEKFMELMESHLGNLKFLAAQVNGGDLEELAKERCRKHIEALQIMMAGLMVKIGTIEYRIFKNRDFNFYHGLFIKEFNGGYISSPKGQQELFDMLDRSCNRLRSTFAIYADILSTAQDDTWKIEREFKLSYLSLK